MGKAAEQWAQFGIEGAQDVLQTGLGIAMAGYNDKRQIKQQGKLNDLMAKTSNQLTDYNYAKQLQMWHDTNYSAQMEELKKAGLNPALLYGMSGGGGVTTGSGSGASAGGAQAPAGGREIMDLQGLGIQKRMAEAQIKVAESQANLNNTEAAKKSGVDTQEAESRIASLTQGVNNQKAAEQLTKTQNRIAEFEAEYAGKTMARRIEGLEYTVGKTWKELSLLTTADWIATDTRDTKIQIVKEELVNLTLRNILTDAQTTNVNADTNLKKSNVQVNNAEINAMGQKIMQGWDTLNIEQKKLRLQEVITNWNTNLDRELKNDILNIFESILHGGGNTYNAKHDHYHEGNTYQK